MRVIPDSCQQPSGQYDPTGTIVGQSPPEAETQLKNNEIVKKKRDRIIFKISVTK
jgi:hypothetical protein